MASRREEVVQAIIGMLKLALPNAEHRRDQPLPKRPDPGGTVIVRDGDPGAAEVTLSPLLYTYNHEIELEILGPTSSAARHELLDQMLQQIGLRIEADRSLGGLTEWLEPMSPFTDDVVLDNAEAVRGAQLSIIAVYSTPNPLT